MAFLYDGVKTTLPMKLMLAVGILLLLVPPALTYVVFRFGCQELALTGAAPTANEYTTPFSEIPCTPNAPWLVSYILPNVFYLLYLPVPFMVLLYTGLYSEARFKNLFTLYLIGLFVFVGLPTIVAPAALAGSVGHNPTHNLFLAFWGFIVYVPSLLSLLSFSSFRYLAVEGMAEKKKLAQQVYDQEKAQTGIEVVVDGADEKSVEKGKQKQKQVAREEDEREEQLLKNKKMDISISMEEPPLASGSAFA